MAYALYRNDVSSVVRNSFSASDAEVDEAFDGVSSVCDAA